MTGCALILAGPGRDDHYRTFDLIDSLATHEPDLGHIVIVDDNPIQRFPENLSWTGSSSVLHVLRNPDSRFDLTTLGANCLFALAYVHDFLHPTYVLKLDTDALVIAPFAAKISQKLESAPLAGMVGLLFNTCDRSRSHSRAHDDLKRMIDDLAAAVSRFSCDDDLDRWLRGWPPRKAHSTAAGLRRFLDRFGPLTANGFSGAHCNGGAYAVSRRLLQAMARAKAFDDRSFIWSSFPFSEDRMMGLYCGLFDAPPVDFSSLGETFGTQAAGLAFAPNDLLERGHGIIHSLKSDDRFAESSVRAFFEAERCRRREM